MKTSRPNSANASVRKSFLLMTVAFFLTMLSGIIAAPLLNNVMVSDVGIGNNIGNASSSRNMAVGPDGSIYVVFSGSAGIRVAKSTDNGMTFNPSVFVGNGNYEAEIETAVNGFIYIVWRNNLNTYFSMSFDGGRTFRNPAPIAPMPKGKATHIAILGSNVFVLSEYSNSLLVNNNFGFGTFTPMLINSTRAFTDVLVEPNTGAVYAVSESPSLAVFASYDLGKSFTQLVLSGNYPIFSGSYATYSDLTSNYLFAFGLAGQSYRINLIDGNVTHLISGNNVGNPRGRTIATDISGILVDGFSENGILKFQSSMNLGMNWEPETIIPAGQSHNVFVNPFTKDILVTYSNNGRVFCNTYRTTPEPIPVAVNTLSVDKITCNSAMATGTVANNNSGMRGFAYGLSENPTIYDSYVIENGPDGLFKMELNGLCPGTTYFVRAFAIDASGQEYYALENMIFITNAPSFTLTLTPNELLLPNHKMNMVNAYITNDAGCGFTAILSSLASNEPDEGLDPEDRPFDIQFAELGTSDMSFNLRAEYSVAGIGRIYTAVYTVFDDCGNIYNLLGTVTVPNLFAPKKGTIGINNTFNVYPNPTIDYLRIDLNSEYVSDARILLTDLMGNTIYDNAYSNVSNLQEEIDIQNLSTGTYFMYVKFGSEQFVRKIIKI